MVNLLEFEWDEAKSRANKAKHGINVVPAQALWLDESLAETPTRSDIESRSMAVGIIDGEHRSAFIPHRGDKVGLISVRRSRREEVASYGR